MAGCAFSLAGWPPPNSLPNRETRNLTLHKQPQFRPGELRKRTGTYRRSRNLSSVPRTSVHFSNEEICNYWVVVAWGFGENTVKSFPTIKTEDTRGWTSGTNTTPEDLLLWCDTRAKREQTDRGAKVDGTRPGSCFEILKCYVHMHGPLVGCHFELISWG